MGRKCLVADCLSEEGRQEDCGVTFHKIPLHSDIRPKWLSLCRIPEDKYAVKVIHVCSRHFLKANFCRFKGKKYMLRQGVLPSVFPWSKIKKEATTPTPLEEEIKKEPVDDATEENNKSLSDNVFGIKEEPLVEDVMDIKDELILNSMSDSFVTVPSQTEPDVKLKTPEIRRESISTTTIEQREQSIETSTGILNFKMNTHLEALDFNQAWLPAQIIEVDYEESEVLIHFEKYSSKYDEWINMNSSRLRPVQPTPSSSIKRTPCESFVIGEKCMASWSNSRKFPATVTKIFDHETYEVLFNDGVFKVLKAHRMAKTDGKLVGLSPLFDPAEGTKQQRRDKKRKLNVSELFRKRTRIENVADTAGNVQTNEDNIASPCEEPEVPLIMKWENGKPVGADSTIETHDGPKKSTIVSDPRLPPNWQKHLVQRTTGVTIGKWDVILLSPEGRRFRTRNEIKSFIEENPELNYKESMFDFTLRRRTRTPRRIATEASAVLLDSSVPEPIEEELSLKIPIVDDVYKCPIEGCGKSFRRENLAQMHVKHYHPKFTKFLDSTPNVADLAYARTVGESLDKSPDRARGLITRQGQKTGTPKSSTPKAVSWQSPSEIETSADSQKNKDSEILKLLNTKPPEDGILKYPPGLPTSMYPDFKLKDLLNKSEGIPKREDLNLKSLSASTTRPTGIKTLLPVVRTSDKKDGGELEAGTKKNIKRKRQASENLEPTPQEILPVTTPVIKQEPVQPEQSTNYIVEGGEVIKIVRMKREEIINCTCGITEEDGLMIQCEVCLCWQHAYCNNIERENQVPEKYICYICQNPMRQRSSRKYYHDQDWLKNGTLPAASYRCKDNDTLKKRFETLKKTHDLTGGLLELKDFMHSLKVKIKIAEAKNHPKLYLWSKPWAKLPLPEKMESESAEETKPKLDTLTKSEINLLTNKNDSMLLSILKSTKDEQKFKDDIDLNSLMHDQQSAPIIPQPEAAIETADCKLNLLDHIAHCHTLVEQRLDDILAQTEAFEGGSSNNNDADYLRTTETIQMLLRDLNTLKDLSHSSSL